MFRKQSTRNASIDFTEIIMLTNTSVLKPHICREFEKCQIRQISHGQKGAVTYAQGFNYFFLMPASGTTLLISHWGRDKITGIWQTIFLYAFSCMECSISIKISLNFVPKGPVDKIPALFQIMALLRIGDKPLSELMIAYLTQAYMSHSSSMI